MVARATRRQEVVVQPSPTAAAAAAVGGDTRASSLVFSQNYDDGVSLFNGSEEGENSNAAEMKATEELKTESNDGMQDQQGEEEKYHNPLNDDGDGFDPLKNNWLPDLLLLIAHLGYDKCFREISQCVAMLLIDLNAPAPVPLKDKTGGKLSHALSVR